MEIQDKLKIVDLKGFHFEVTVSHRPAAGISVATYEGKLLASREYGRFSLPATDDDRDWEEFHERFHDFIGGPMSDLERTCSQYFNQVYSKSLKPVLTN